jgi:hypothetical protein
MTTFADHLFEDLMAEHGAELTSAAAAAQAPAPSPHRRYTRPAWATAGTVAAAGAAAVGFSVFGTTAAAYAVTDNHDGTVTVSVSKSGGVTGANSKLHTIGADVVVLKATPGCPSITSFGAPNQNVGKTTLGMAGGPGRSTTITVQATGLPKNETMLVAFDFDHPMQRVAAVLVDDPVPTCVSLPALPPKNAVTGTGGGRLSQTGGPDSGSVPALNQQNG